MVPMGMQEANATVVGNAIGENDVPLAKKYFKVATAIGIPSILTWSTSFYLLRY